MGALCKHPPLPGKTTASRYRLNSARSIQAGFALKIRSTIFRSVLFTVF
jgi:hypothetical protein